MAYDDSRYRAEWDQRTDEDAAGGYGPSSLDDVFDDPAHGEPGRDRFGVHLVWELLLLFGVAVLGYVLYRDSRFAVTGDGLRALMISATILGLLTLGAGLSLRAASPNLAIGPIALGSALYFADHASRGLLVAAGQAGVLALVVGAAIAIVTVGLHVPAWAASFGAGLGVVVWIERYHQTLDLPRGWYQPVTHADYWFGGFALLAVLGGFIGSFRSVRRGVGRFRPVGDPAHRRGGGAAAMSVVALLGSSVFAAGAGVLTALQDRRVEATDTSLALTGLALGGALLAGTSAFGRRGGMLGGLLAAALLAVVLRYLRINHPGVSQLAVGAGAIGVGLVATRLVETFGRPRPAFAPEVDQWRTVNPAAGTVPAQATPNDEDWNGARPMGWTSPLPAASADDRWREDWGNR